ncbi:MAG: 3-deoxy-manno-octulosonate cytidylyltransferase [Alphaproteobacteria bacterium]|nr:3-deoxy-manno-octulosonate cytidylyltransferase [Alphaproteobacteria bacterium]
MTPVVVVIPARLDSSRLPRKALADIAGRPMIQHVWERARAAQGVDRVLVATPDGEIAEACAGFGAEVAWTRADHASGSDRVAEVAQGLPAGALLVNVQGDEPLLEPALVGALARLLREGAEMASVMTPIRSAETWTDPAAVKVVCDDAGHALYFSRAPVPHGAAPTEAWRHLGLYAYRRETLLKISAAPPSALERAERLEQLRALAMGVRIRMLAVEQAARGVDTPADLARVRAILSARGGPHAG